MTFFEASSRSSFLPCAWIFSEKLVPTFGDQALPSRRLPQAARFSFVTGRAWLRAVTQT
jgi:hypothetical protein